MNYLVIDDEELARKRLISLIKECNLDFTCLGEAANATEGIKNIHQLNPDLIFLDIQMPQLSGFDLLDLLPTDMNLKVIFVTAYDEFALKAFEAHAIDYLLKPVKKTRLEDSLKRLLQTDSQQNETSDLKDIFKQQAKPLQRMAVHFKQETLLIPIESISWIESKDSLTFVHTKDGKQYRTDKTLDEIENRLADFFRLHRSYLVSLNEIQKVIPWFNGGIKVELSNGVQLEVAKRRIADLKRVLSL